MQPVISQKKNAKYVMKSNLFAIEIGKTSTKMNKLVYLGGAIFELSKALMYKFCQDYMHSKYESMFKL